MSYPSRPLPSHLRQPSTSGSTNASSTGQSPILLARINEKKIELENLKQLRDLSAGLAGQMTMLEEKLATLADGTEAVALVLGNWQNVLRAISLASSRHLPPHLRYSNPENNEPGCLKVKIPKPKVEKSSEENERGVELIAPLPQTLVRIPTKDAPKLQQVEGEGGVLE